MRNSQGLRLVSQNYWDEHQRAARLAALEALHSKQRAKERRDYWLFWAFIAGGYAGAYWLAVKLTEWIAA